MLTFLSDMIREAAAHKRPLRIRGGGSKDFYGHLCDGTLLDTSTHSGIVDYEPSELYVTVRCGTPLSSLERLLAEHGQILPFEPPDFGARGDATIGGAVAAGLSGPRRAYAGAVRDFILGVRMIDGRGDDLEFGGRVMKNVAGYDVSRVMAGAMGTLGVLTEVTLKVLPAPQCERTLRFDMSRLQALEALNRWAGQPLPLSASMHDQHHLWIRLSGARAAVDAAHERLGGEAVESTSLWMALRNHTHSFFERAQPLWRIAVPSTAADALPSGEQLVEWGGALRWLQTDASARSVREAAERLGGHATAFRQHSAGVATFHPLAPGLMEIHRRLKREFDPQGIFNPGRLYAEL